MQNLVVLLVAWIIGLGMVAVMVRRKEIWDWIRPHRRGPTDPTWASVGVAVIALGSVSIAIAAATASTTTTTVRGASGPITKVTTNPQPIFLWVGGILVGLGVLGIIGLAIAAYLRWKDDRLTPFHLFYDPANVNCNEIGYRDVPLPNPTPPPDVQVLRDDWQQVRVGVKNIGPVGVQRVRARIEFPDNEHRSYFLHLQNDNDPLQHLSRNGEYLTTDDKTYFDVAVVKWNDPFTGFAINYADQSISEMSRRDLKPQSYRVRITVSGWSDFRDVVSKTKEFVIKVDQNLHLSMTPTESTPL